MFHCVHGGRDEPNIQSFAHPAFCLLGPEHNIYRSCIFTTSIYDSLPLSLVPKKTGGACTLNVPKNH